MKRNHKLKVNSLNIRGYHFELGRIKTNLELQSGVIKAFKIIYVQGVPKRMNKKSTDAKNVLLRIQINIFNYTFYSLTY